MASHGFCYAERGQFQGRKFGNFQMRCMQNWGAGDTSRQTYGIRLVDIGDPSAGEVPELGVAIRGSGLEVIPYPRHLTGSSVDNGSNAVLFVIEDIEGTQVARPLTRVGCREDVRTRHPSFAFLIVSMFSLPGCCQDVAVVTMNDCW